MIKNIQSEISFRHISFFLMISKTLTVQKNFGQLTLNILRYLKNQFFPNLCYILHIYQFIKIQHMLCKFLQKHKCFYSV